ncbi:hypothetical protein CEK28_10615 [Xenophilus sp. AP218F]|nr:hypothetical protein CEK28_10615 [Xenophilus sp. AP218F]
MTLDQYIERCKKAIAANFKARNARVFGRQAMQIRMRKARGDTIRYWISELRDSLNPATSQVVAARVRRLIN